jgi:hypothetical protein
LVQEEDFARSEVFTCQFWQSNNGTTKRPRLSAVRERDGLICSRASGFIRRPLRVCFGDAPEGFRPIQPPSCFDAPLQRRLAQRHLLFALKGEVTVGYSFGVVRCMQKTSSDEPENIHHPEPELVRAMDHWRACSQHGCIQPRVEEGLRELLLNPREVLEAILWCTELERLALLVEILSASYAALRRLLRRRDLTFAEGLLLYQRISAGLADLTARMERSESSNPAGQDRR